MIPDEHAAAALRHLAAADDWGNKDGYWETPERIGYGLTEAVTALTHAVLSLRPATPAAPSGLYIDREGDVWATAPDGRLWFLNRDSDDDAPWALGRMMAEVEREYGPLRPFPAGPA